MKLISKAFTAIFNFVWDFTAVIFSTIAGLLKIISGR